ncbi:hypothetical protein ACFLXB_05085 [Chloroflexota bacterium]
MKVNRGAYEFEAEILGVVPETPKYPNGAIYVACYKGGKVISVQMTDGNKRDNEITIPVGTYRGDTLFLSTLDNDVDNSFLVPECTENFIQVTIGSDGTAHGEIRSICFSNRDTDNDEMRTVHHSEVTGVIEGILFDNSSQLTISYTWRSYFTSPQWDTTSLDDTVEFVFPYHVQVTENTMILEPAADVEDYYSFLLYRE